MGKKFANEGNILAKAKYSCRATVSKHAQCQNEIIVMEFSPTRINLFSLNLISRKSVVLVILMLSFSCIFSILCLLGLLEWKDAYSADTDFTFLELLHSTLYIAFAFLYFTAAQLASVTDRPLHFVLCNSTGDLTQFAKLTPIQNTPKLFSPPVKAKRWHWAQLPSQQYNSFRKCSSIRTEPYRDQRNY